MCPKPKGAAHCLVITYCVIRVQFNNMNASSSNMAMSHNYGRNQNIFVCIFVKHTRKEYFRKHERLTQYSVSSILLLHFSLFIFVSLSIAAQKRYCKDHLILRTLAGSSVTSLAISDVVIFNTVFGTLCCGGLLYPLTFTF